MARPRYFEDFALGEPFATANHQVTLEEAIAFAAEHDPQYFHTDPERARGHPVFQGISASGFLTMTITHRLILEQDIGHAWGLVGKGIERLRWHRPVRPGDTLTVRGAIVGAERDPAQPFGVLTTDVETLNQRGERVMSFTVAAIVPSRDVLAPSAAAA
jgi:acyl dehydratase